MTKLQQQLAEQFLHILEEEKLDWRKEWSGIPERPYNPISKTCLLYTSPSPRDA